MASISLLKPSHLACGVLLHVELYHSSTLACITQTPSVVFATGLAEFNWSEGESTLHLSSEEHISEGGHAFVLKVLHICLVPWSC